MCIKETIKDPDLFSTLRKNPYAHDIFKKELDFHLEVFEENEAKKYLIFKRKINGNIGYVVVIERDFLSAEEMKMIYKQYKNTVVELSNNNFREVELVVVCKRVNREVLEFIKEYNRRYPHRPPIRLILNTY
ncbi:hypothetical protein [Atrimonas thermophila]|uniref:hypothetical protein n=1 Tax=Atrimonas thermophila TaxID=3064161 RepID=UPI00399D0C5B